MSLSDYTQSPTLDLSVLYDFHNPNDTLSYRFGKDGRLFLDGSFLRPNYSFHHCNSCTIQQASAPILGPDFAIRDKYLNALSALPELTPVMYTDEIIEIDLGEIVITGLVQNIGKARWQIEQGGTGYFTFKYSLQREDRANLQGDFWDLISDFIEGLTKAEKNKLGRDNVFLLIEYEAIGSREISYLISLLESEQL